MTSLWVLWAFLAMPYQMAGFEMTPGWISVAGALTRTECLEVLKHIPSPATCIPAGILLRPLSVQVGQPQPPTIQPYAEWDIAPEFR